MSGCKLPSPALKTLATPRLYFRDSSRIHGLILSAIREKLLGSNLSPAAVARPALTPMPAESERVELRQRLAARNGPSDGDLAERIARSEALAGELDADVVIVNVETPEAAAAQLFNVVRPSYTRQ